MILFDGTVYETAEQNRLLDLLEMQINQTRATLSIDAETVIRAHVPPCVFRDFTEAAGGESYREAVWKNGELLYLPLEPKDQLYIYDIKHA